MNLDLGPREKTKEVQSNQYFAIKDLLKGHKISFKKATKDHKGAITDHNRPNKEMLGFAWPHWRAFFELLVGPLSFACGQKY